jgi:hypothetical protein
VTNLASDLTTGSFGQSDANRSPGSALPGGDAAALFTREARRSGRLVLSLRCSRRGEGFVVECDTYNVSASADAAPKRRAFAFRDRPGAERFAAETLRALEYLGCRIA